MRFILKSKIILLFKYLIIFIILLISYFRTKSPINYKYSEGVNTVTGIITKYNKKEDYNLIEVISKEKIRVNVYDNTKYLLGDKVLITGNINYINRPSNFNMFRYDLYMMSKGIKYSMNASSIKVIKKNNNMFYKLKYKFLKHASTYKKDAYLKALLLGDNNISNNQKKKYQTLGISHLFSLSGMHVSYMVGILLFIFKKLKKDSLGKILITIFLIFYLFLTDFSPSLIRSTLLVIVFFYIKYIKKDDLLLIIFCFLLIINPYYLYNPGFLYSFIISYVFILFLNNNHNNYLNGLLKSSIMAFLVSLPITLYLFYEINIVSIITNIIFIPLFSFVIFPFTIITYFIPILDYIYNIVINMFESLVSFVSCYSLIINFPRVSIIIYFIYEFLIYIFYKTKSKQAILVFIILLFIHYNYYNFFSMDNIVTFDVDQGDSILINLNHNKNNILIDTGGKVGSLTSRYVGNIIIPYLKSKGIKKIGYLIISHGDFDHMGEAVNLVNNFKVEKVIFNCGEFNGLEKELIKVLNKKKIEYYSCIKELNIDKNKLYFLQTKEYDNENDNSNVIYTNLNGYKFMFMGDASSTTEKEILSKYNLPNIDVLKVGHHGSKTSSSEEFINKTNPKYSIISVGKNNRYGHPNKEVLGNLDNSKIYRTDQDGSVIFKIKDNKLNIETCAP